MSIVMHRPDQFAIAQPYLAPGDRVASWIDDLKWPAYTWRRWLRRLYVLTWPFSVAARAVMFLVLGLAWLGLGIGGFFLARLAYTWHGERSPWD